MGSVRPVARADANIYNHSNANTDFYADTDEYTNEYTDTHANHHTDFHSDANVNPDADRHAHKGAHAPCDSNSPFGANRTCRQPHPSPCHTRNNRDATGSAPASAYAAGSAYRYTRACAH